MNKDKTYQKLLNKMLIIENIGEILYGALTLKAKDNNLKSIYERLALNERQTAECIEKEILKTDKNSRILIAGAVLNLANVVFCMLTKRQLVWILRSVLTRRIYSRWYGRYKDNNRDFWSLLLKHENLQHELLGLSLDN